MATLIASRVLAGAPEDKLALDGHSAMSRAANCWVCPCKYGTYANVSTIRLATLPLFQFLQACPEKCIAFYSRVGSRYCNVHSTFLSLSFQCFLCQHPFGCVSSCHRWLGKFLVAAVQYLVYWWRSSLTTSSPSLMLHVCRTQ